MQPGQRRVDVGAGGLDLGADGGQRLGELAVPGVGLGVPGGRLVDGGLHLEQRGGARRAAERPVRAEQVTVDGDRAQAGLGQLAGLLEGVDHGDLPEQPGQRRPQLFGRLQQVQRPARARRQRRPRVVVAVRRPADQQPGPSGVVRPEPGQGGGGVGGRADRHRVGSGAERRGDGGLLAGRHPDQRGDGAEHPRQPRREQRPGAVLAGQRHGQRVAPGQPGGAVPLGVALLGLQGPAALLGVGERRGRGLVPGVEVDLAVVEPTGLVLHGGELGRGPLRAGPGVGERGAEPAELGLAGGRARPQRADLPGQPGQALAPVGDRADRRHQRLLLGDQGRLDLAAPGGGRAQPLGVGGQRPAQLRLRLAGGGRLAVQRLRVAPLPGLLRQRRPEVAAPGGGQVGGAPQPLLQRGQPVPGVLGSGQPRRLVGGSRLQTGLPRLQRGDRGLHLGPPGTQGRLVAHLGLDGRAQRHEVVGEQPQPGVPLVGLDLLGPPGELGLPTERLELAAHLGGQVLQAGEVGLHRVELAQGLLLALLVLEDPGGLLDEGPPVLGPRGQHRVELALPDDDVQLAADAAVAHQLLHVDQPAAVAVDGVLRLPRAEHQPPDRDLRVVDRQRAVAVVDGQRDLGATQRRAAGRAGEDDVLHLPAAQRLRALLAEHPGHRVDDVALARAVRAHDAGDAGLEAQRRGGREGLEPLQRQALQVHPGKASRAGHGRGRPARGRPQGVRVR